MARRAAEGLEHFQSGVGGPGNEVCPDFEGALPKSLPDAPVGGSAEQIVGIFTYDLARRMCRKG